MTKRYLGNIITQNPTAPAGNFEGSAAKGVWSLEEQLAYQKAGLWPIPGNLPPDVTDVFSTYLYEGTSAAHTITNGIDLAGEGGLVWTKVRTQTDSHYLWDTERGVNKRLSTNQPYGENNETDALNSFNSNGFTLGSAGNVNSSAANLGSAADYASWTFRKAPKFFTMVTWNGTGNENNTINHDLGCVPGMIIVKRINSSANWIVYHRGVNGGTNPEQYNLQLDNTNPQDQNSIYFSNTAPTDTTFTVGSLNSASNGTYIAYLFAHNDGDGGFGPDGSDIIKCGSFTPDGSENATIDLGFEPQWFLVKSATGSGSWLLYDNMRGMTASGSADYYLLPNSSSAEGTGSYIAVTPTGIDWSGTGGGNTFIYMAIRRGPLAAPTAATEVFDVEANSSNAITTGFPVDWRISKRRSGSAGYTASRLTGNTVYNATESTSAEFTSGANFEFDSNTGVVDDLNGGSDPYVRYAWKRAPGYFDVVAYTGTGSAMTVSHNLGVAPEMMWVKKRSSGDNWRVYHSGIGIDYTLGLDSSSARSYDPALWNGTDPTSTVFSLGNDSSVIGSGSTFIAYLFSTLAGISKVGSFTGNGSSQTIDCGFTSGARFVLIKRAVGGSGGWYVWDSVRGIVAGNDPFLVLNNTNAETTSVDLIDPASSGFAVNYDVNWSFNQTGNTYIFYAIA